MVTILLIYVVGVIRKVTLAARVRRVAQAKTPE